MLRVHAGSKMTDPTQLTVLLRRLRDGDEAAAEAMVPFVYEDLRGVARNLLGRDRQSHTLQPTALVHEAWLKIQRALDHGADLRDRHHFFAVASQAMRQVLVNHARDRAAQKRGAGAQRIPLDECLASLEHHTGPLLELDDVLRQLAGVHPRPARVVEMRVFGGMTVEEVAVTLGVTESAVKTDWRFARAWLRQRLPEPGS